MSTVLLVEDDLYIGRVYERAFRLAGHQMEIIIDGEMAWNALSTRDLLPAAIILDIMLPKMSGTELLEKIKKDKRLAHLPVAVLTNSFDEDLERKLLVGGADLFLIKVDHEPKEIVSMIEELISKSH